MRVEHEEYICRYCAYNWITSAEPTHCPACTRPLLAATRAGGVRPFRRLPECRDCRYEDDDCNQITFDPLVGRCGTFRHKERNE